MADQAGRIGGDAYLVRVLRVYADLDRPPRVPWLVPVVLPFLPADELAPLLEGDLRWRRFVQEAPDYLSLETADACDVAVFSIPWQFAAGDEELRERARVLGSEMLARGKRTLVFCHSDEDFDVPVPGSVVFKCSGYASSRRGNEFAQPAFGADLLLETGGRVPLRVKQVVPSVGFCGQAMQLARPSRRTRIKWLLRSSGIPVGHEPPAREAAIRALAADRRVQTRFILRDATPWELRAATPRSWAAEFRANMLENDYALCVRGNGNHSLRLWEALSAGRIPVFVNTDCVLPCEEEIDWREVFVWVEETEIERIGDRVLEFHERLTEAEFMDRQRQCRALWERYASPHGFHRWLATSFLPRL